MQAPGKPGKRRDGSKPKKGVKPSDPSDERAQQSLLQSSDFHQTVDQQEADELMNIFNNYFDPIMAPDSSKKKDKGSKTSSALKPAIKDSHSGPSQIVDEFQIKLQDGKVVDEPPIPLKGKPKLKAPPPELDEHGQPILSKKKKLFNDNSEIPTEKTKLEDPAPKRHRRRATGQSRGTSANPVSKIEPENVAIPRRAAQASQRTWNLPRRRPRRPRRPKSSMNSQLKCQNQFQSLRPTHLQQLQSSLNPANRF